MGVPISLPITTVVDTLPDLRRETEHTLHRLTDILTLAPCAAEGWDAIAEYGDTKEAFPATAQRHPERRHLRSGVR